MKDLKYLLAYTVPLAALIGFWNQGIWSYTAVIYAFGLIPLIESMFKPSSGTYTTDQKANRLADRFFDWMLYLNIPIVFGMLYYGIRTLVYTDLELYETIGLVISLGIVIGTNGINVAHELGHRQTAWERMLSKLLLIPSLNMHFYMEHNFGHHQHVATLEDPATAKKGQAVYAFWITSILGQYISAWRIQLKQLKIHNRSFFSIYNDMLFYVLIQIGYLAAAYLWLGPRGLWFVFISAVVSLLLLETINYIEHYGLLRNKVNGRYERVRTVHSWNSNHVIGRMVLYELTRHSGHHYRTTKKYQILENKDESPQLPYGYTTSMVLAMVPPLWFRIMNRRIPQVLGQTAN